VRVFNAGRRSSVWKFLEKDGTNNKREDEDSLREIGGKKGV